MLDSTLYILKSFIYTNRLVLIQSSFRVLLLGNSRPNMSIFTLIRRNSALLFKSALIISLIGGSVSIKKKLSDFYSIYSKTNEISIRPILLKKIGQSLNQNDRTRITKVTFGKSFNINIVLIDILKIIKRARLENLYDFFNFPIKFNAIVDLSYIDFIILSMYSNRNEKASK